MPVRSLNSSVLKWPTLKEMLEAVSAWAREIARKNSQVLRVGLFGSYARGNWGVGSDVDIVIIVRETVLPFERRSIEFDSAKLPVPADILVYTVQEWQRKDIQNLFARQGILWVFER